MAAPRKKQLERFYYWQGQRLLSGDFNRIAEDNDQRRWWHNRALHNAFGVYRGFEVVQDYTLEHVTVYPGLAYDSYGRELILSAPCTIAVPTSTTSPTGHTYNLILRLTEPPCSCQPAPSTAACLPGKFSGSGNVTLFWQDVKSRPSDDCVVIGVLLEKGAVRALSTYSPNRVRPNSRPLLASGTTIPGATPWGPWSLLSDTSDADPDSYAIGIQVNVNTSSAGFTSVPCYFAWLHGPLWNSVTHDFFPAYFPSTANESATGFTFRLLFNFQRQELDQIQQATNTGARTITGALQGNISPMADFLRYAVGNSLYVAWLGCQMPPQVPFVPIAQNISNLVLLKNLLTQVQLR